MAYIKQDDAAAVRALMRSMYFSNGTIDGFLATATAGQVSAVRGLIASELELRDRRKRERLVRKARFPQVKSFGGYDFSQVALPEGYGVDDLSRWGSSSRRRTSSSTARPAAARPTSPSPWGWRARRRERR